MSLSLTSSLADVGVNIRPLQEEAALKVLGKYDLPIRTRRILYSIVEGIFMRSFPDFFEPTAPHAEDLQRAIDKRVEVLSWGGKYVRSMPSAYAPSAYGQIHECLALFMRFKPEVLNKIVDYHLNKGSLKQAENVAKLFRFTPETIVYLKKIREAYLEAGNAEESLRIERIYS